MNSMCDQRMLALISTLPDQVYILDQEGSLRDILNLDEVLEVNDIKKELGSVISDLNLILNDNNTHTKDIQTSDGHWYELRLRKINKKEILVVLRDVTYFKNNTADLEEIIYQRTQKLTEANDELEQFAYSASHDLKEPLQKIISYGGRLIEVSDNLSESQLNYINVMVNASSRLKIIIDDLLLYARTGKEFQHEKVDLNLILDGIKTDLQETIKSKNGTITYNDLGHVQGSDTMLRLLFQNLISNSLKFSKKDVPSVIEIKRDENVITVSDNGIGFDPKYKNQIFQLFERLHSRFEYPGTGIGLALCKKIMTKHEGTIEAVSEPSVGTKIILNFEGDVE